MDLSGGQLQLEETAAKEASPGKPTTKKFSPCIQTALDACKSDSAAKEIILNICLTYILQTAKGDDEAVKIAENDALAVYASFFWIDFLPANPSTDSWKLIESLFLGSREQYYHWLQLLYRATDVYINNKHGSRVLALSGSSPEGYGCRAPPIVWAAALGLKPIVERLIARGDDVNEAGAAKVNALYMAVHEIRQDILELLLEHGGDVSHDFPEDVSSTYGSLTWRSPMYHAARWGKYELLEILLRDNSKYGRPGWVLEVAMMHAAESNHATCLRYLLDAGANINITGIGSKHRYSISPDGGSALQKAAWEHNMETFKLLLDAGADVNVRGGLYETALQAAAERGRRYVHL